MHYKKIKLILSSLKVDTLLFLYSLSKIIDSINQNNIFMLARIRNSRFAKILSVWIVLNFLGELLIPQKALALTGGPSQPEMAGFTPVNTDDMVDLFSGNFHYTIPLLVVPGPNGGYPVNLNYNSGIGMEHEASWVGLGWNLNPGAINRQVRGIPDDCNGDNVTKIYKRRNNNTFIFTPSGGVEGYGANFSLGANLASSIVYNTYMGISLSNHYGISASYVRNGNVADKRSKIVTGNAGVNFDSNNGISPSFSMSGQISKNLTIGGNFGYNSKSGAYTFGNQISLSVSRSYNVKDQDGNNKTVKQGVGTRMGSSFSTASTLPPVSVPLETNTFSTSFQLGGASNFVEGFGGVSANISIQKTKPNPVETPAYGLLYAHNATKKSLQDYNREKDIGVDQHSLNLPLPVVTHDVYNINGELLNGNFRAYRSDYGHFFDNYVENYSATSVIGADLALGNGAQTGGTISSSESSSSNGDWSTGYERLLVYKSKREYGNRKGEDAAGISPALYEPFYFKMNGEKTAMSTDYLNTILDEEAVNFPLEKNIGSSLFGNNKRIYTISRTLKNKGGATRTMNTFVQKERSKRTYNIEYETRTSTDGDKKKDHIDRFTIVNGNGERFTYGQPLYNLVEKEVSFSLPYQPVPAALKKSIVETYPAVCTDPNANMNQRMGKERLYSSTTTPAYAHTYPIRYITSADYVDLTGNGPSDDDFGYWVKFDYTPNQRYRWRFPYKGAHLMIGDVSNRQDDKGSYTYGEKEISYLKEITTKTHKAVFYISARKDACEARNEREGGLGTLHLQKLDSICLYSLQDLTIPIKSAHFEYDYSLCHNVPNNSLPASERQRGKLTLKKVYFKYAGSEKGKENPYLFNYVSGENYNYDPVLMDRWGNYKGNANYFEHYVTQGNKAQQDRWAKAWCLSNIILPSGGSIDIDYESGDYAYVQNKQALSMAQMTRTSSFTGKGPHYVYFRIRSGDNPIDYVRGFDNNLMFFKVAVQASDKIQDPDYVQGYIKVKPETARKASNTEGYVEVEKFDAYNIHPIYFLCLQHLRNNRPDLLFNGYDANDNQSDAKAFFRALVSQGIIAQANAMYGNDNFYRYCINKTSYFKNPVVRADMPSYLRLNVPDKIKYGGGVRVKSITLSDNWDKSEPTQYRREYVYRKMENGKLISSGVAEYEPMVGAEETALRYPVYDEATGLFFKEDEIYSEVPYGESYFPGANVGYSQVIVKTYTPSDVQLSTSGIQVSRFYTAYDFPITVSQTRLQAEVDPTPGILNIITAGFKQVASSAYSQGYQIELNDMHGKTRSVATYPYQYTANDTELASMIDRSGPVTSVEYYYKEKKTRGVRKVDNRVSVLVDDAVPEMKRLGQTYDFIVDMRENHTVSKGGGISANVMLGTYTPPIPGVSAMPTIDSFEETVRSVTTAKVIYNSGVLEKTIAYNNGSKVTTTNLHFDPYTGEPLLSTVTNEFDKPVYNYSMPAYWFHEDMGSAAENYRAAYVKSWNTHNNITPFGQYDRFLLNGNATNRLTINNITGSGQSVTVRYWNSSGGTYANTPTELEIYRSRKSNQLSAVAASTLSLTDPVAERRFPLFDAFNAKPAECVPYTDCQGTQRYAKVFFYLNKLYFASDEIRASDLCLLSNQSIVQNNLPYVVVNTPSNIAGYPISSFRFYKRGQQVEIFRNGSRVGIYPWQDPRNVFTECQDGMLQASAMEFGTQWQYPYQDVGITSPPSAGRENYLGIRNIHRPLRSDVFITERKQTGGYPDYRTNIAYDGTFESFSYFLHEGGNADNMQDPWKWSTEITKYSPFNFEIENKNALGIYSSALYGYRNSMATAVANNARYCEIGYAGFEEETTGSSIANQKKGHFLFDGGTVYNGGHTGKKSVQAPTGSSALSLKVNTRADLSTAPSDGIMTLQRGKTYLFSCWISVNLINVSAVEGVPFKATVGSATITNIETQARIDGWQKVEFEFTVPANSANQVTLKLERTNSGGFFFDDVRIVPFSANMRSYAYDPANYRLVAELDENNYASFYNYDEEGILVQIKKETERGVMTLQTTRQNLKH